MREFIRYRGPLVASLRPQLAEAAHRSSPADSISLGVVPAALLLDNDPTLHRALANGFRHLASRSDGQLADLAGDYRPVHYAFVAHLHLAAFGRLYETLPVSVWSACEDAIPGLIAPLRSSEAYGERAPPRSLTDVVLWQALCILEQAKLLQRDIDAEWVNSVVHQIVAQTDDDAVDPPTALQIQLRCLHALADLALVARHRSWLRRVTEMAVQLRRRVDSTHLDWALFAFAWVESTRNLAEHRLASLPDNPPDLLGAMLLADCAHAMSGFST